MLVLGAHCVFCEGRAKLWNVTVINVVLQRPYRSVGGLLDLSHVEFLVYKIAKIALGHFYPGVSPVNVIPLVLVVRAVPAEGQKSEAC